VRESLQQKRGRPPSIAATALLVAMAALQPNPSMAVDSGRSEEDHALIIEVGAAGERELSSTGSTHAGPAVGLEAEPIENWLEIELGAATFRDSGARVWDVDIPLKKPFRISETLEVMPGVGPTWEHTNRTGERADTFGGELVIDFFIWSSRRMGWFIEPAYGVAFAQGHKTSATITAGFFAAIP
jgi:hypothetical protein